jgi:hypothetical protein
MAMVLTGVLRNGSHVLSSRLFSVCHSRLNHEFQWTNSFSATIFQKLPDLKIAVPLDEIKYTPPHMDVGILELPITF